MMCPHCGKVIDNKTRRPTRPNGTKAQLIDLLKNNFPHRQIYKGINGNWYVTYGGGQWLASIVQEIVEEKIVKPVFSDTKDCYHMGQTIDTEATLNARKLHGKHTAIIYLED